MSRRPSRVLNPTLEFIRLLWSIQHRLQTASKRMESTLGVTGPQRLVLRMLGQHPDLTAHALAQTLHLHPSTVTGILQRLEKKGLVVRERDAADNRRVRLRLTSGGRRLNGRSTGTIESVIAQAFRRVRSAQIAEARIVLAAIADALTEDH